MVTPKNRLYNSMCGQNPIYTEMLKLIGKEIFTLLGSTILLLKYLNLSSSTSTLHLSFASLVFLIDNLLKVFVYAFYYRNIPFNLFN